jgi:hypothetical protein
VAHYRLYVVDHTGRVIAGDDANCPNDEVAADIARSMLRDGTSTEAWLGTRLVAQFVSPHAARLSNRTAAANATLEVTQDVTRDRRPEALSSNTF